jgi:hypothetical protein
MTTAGLPTLLSAYYTPDAAARVSGLPRSRIDAAAARGQIHLRNGLVTRAELLKLLREYRVE